MFTFFTTCGFGPRACCNNLIKRLIALVVICFIIGGIGYAHLYNGEVGLDGQVLAFLISIWTVLTFHFVFRGPIYHHIRELHEGKTRNPGLPIKTYLLYAGGLCFTFFMAGMINYWIVASTVTNDPKWGVNIREKCHSVLEQEGMNLDRFYSGAILAQFGWLGYLLGAYYGVLFTYVRYEGTWRFKSPNKYATIKTILRMVLLLSYCVPNTIVMILVPPAANLYV